MTFEHLAEVPSSLYDDLGKLTAIERKISLLRDSDTAEDTDVSAASDTPLAHIVFAAATLLTSKKSD